MSVFKVHRGKRITPKDKNWAKGTWYVYKRLNGKVIHKAIKEARTKEEAEQAEREIIRRAFDKKYGTGSNEKFGGFVTRVYQNYVRQNNISLATKGLYIRLLCTELGERGLDDITPQELRNVQARFRKRYAASTVNQLMSTTSKIFTLACQEGILDKNPMQYVTRLKEPPPRDRLLTKEEKERLWKELEKDFLLMRLVTLATNLPLRRAQLLAIHPDALDTRTGSLLISPSKGRTARLIPLNNTAALTLSQMLADGQLPFPLKETGIRKRWMKALKRAKIEGYRFHDLRHEMATELAMKGAHMKTIQDLYGHSDMKITGIYVNPQFEAMREAVKSLDERIEEVENVQ